MAIAYLTVEALDKKYMMHCYTPTNESSPSYLEPSKTVHVHQGVLPTEVEIFQIRVVIDVHNTQYSEQKK